MYPRLSDFFKDVVGFELPFPIYSFGAMVAIGVLMASWLSSKELDRLYADGRIPAVTGPSRDSKKGRKKTEKLPPSAIIGTVTVLAVVAGFAGAKLFHILENWSSFVAAPARMVFSTGGFTFYGGLVVAGLTIAWYVKQKGIPVATFADAMAPGLMLGYGVGRIGCHLAGDGDWGVASDLAAKPGWVPTWLWSETYDNNILAVDLSQSPVFPTPLYEAIACTVLFFVLWSLRKHPYVSGWLFSVYLILNGVERFLIEKIRVNNTFDLLGFDITQAEVVSTVLVLTGVFGLARTWRKRSVTEMRPMPSRAKPAAT